MTSNLSTLEPTSFNPIVIRRLSDFGVSLFRINLPYTEIDNLIRVGSAAPYEPPLTPELLIDTKKLGVQEAVGELVKLIHRMHDKYIDRYEGK